MSILFASIKASRAGLGWAGLARRIFECFDFPFCAQSINKSIHRRHTVDGDNVASVATIVGNPVPVSSGHTTNLILYYSITKINFQIG